MGFRTSPASPSRLVLKRPAKLRRFTTAIAVSVALWGIIESPAPASAHQTIHVDLTAQQSRLYPLGVPDTTEPSGEAMPGPDDMPGYRLSYENDFTGTTLPPGWDVFTGVPGGDPGGHFGNAHVVVSGGLLQLNTWEDPMYQDRWVTGGLCQCDLARTYGAYFVRSRVTGLGPNEVELLWPATNAWPPEIDFNETGGALSSTTSSDHFGATNIIVHRGVTIDMTQWHTWGVIWTPNSIIYTVDGQRWGAVTVPSDVPRIRMTLDLEQVAMCSQARLCPIVPVSMLVDWVAEYVPG